MNGLPYYKRYPRDFIEGTIGMPFEVKTTYAFLLDLIYMQGGNLPDDPRYICGLLGVSVRKWKSLRQALIDAGKIHVSGDFLTNYRAVSELESLAKLSRKQSENASGIKKNNNLRKPRPSHTESEPDTDILPPNSPKGDLAKSASQKSTKKTEERKADLLAQTPAEILSQKLPPDLAEGFVEHRKKIRKPMTAKAADLLLKRLATMRDPVAAVERSIVNGYQGVFEDSNDTRRPAQQQRRYDGLPAYINGKGLMGYGR